MSSGKSRARARAKRRAEHSLLKPQSISAFKRWLEVGGAEILPPTNAYEVARYRGAAGLSVIYSNTRGHGYNMTGDARAAWSAFAADKPFDRQQPPQNWIAEEDSRPVPISSADLIQCAAREPLTIAFVMDRNAMPMREASRILFDLERDGLLARSGGTPGAALTWRPANPEAHP